MSDRTCIKSGSRIKIELSAEDLLTCCRDCRFGCNGGEPAAAWQFWVDQGIVTGGLYGGEGCQPYKIEPCEHHVPGPRRNCSEQETPKCEKKCKPGYAKSHRADKHFGRKAYQLNSNSKQIQSEIMRNGPVTAAFTVYSDFPSYKEGVYEQHSDEPLGGHAVRILSWGVENGTPGLSLIHGTLIGVTKVTSKSDVESMNVESRITLWPDCPSFNWWKHSTK